MSLEKKIICNTDNFCVVKKNETKFDIYEYDKNNNIVCESNLLESTKTKKKAKKYMKLLQKGFKIGQDS